MAQQRSESSFIPTKDSFPSLTANQRIRFTVSSTDSGDEPVTATIECTVQSARDGHILLNQDYGPLSWQKDPDADEDTESLFYHIDGKVLKVTDFKVC